MSSPYQKRQIRNKQRRKGKGRKKIPSSELERFSRINVNGMIISSSQPVGEKKKVENSWPSGFISIRPKPKERSRKIGSWREAWEQSLQRSTLHDEFSVKSIVISVVLASMILAGSFFFATKIANIMMPKAEEKSGSQEERVYLPPRF
jgi:hypothetical protein